jgi:hypothetical protein
MFHQANVFQGAFIKGKKKPEPISPGEREISVQVLPAYAVTIRE